IDRFLEVPVLPVDLYQSSSTLTKQRGIHLGTSISLFLANVAAYPLDRRLEQMPVDFARYADDTLIWSPDYSELCRAVQVLQDAGADMGVEINLKKSPGISILDSRQGDSSAPTGAFVPEFKSTASVDFLGFTVSAKTIGIRRSNVVRIKQHLGYLVYAN